MPPPLLPGWGVPAALVACLLIFVHVQLIRQGRLKGPSIVTHFCAVAAIACIPFVDFYVPAR